MAEPLNGIKSSLTEPDSVIQENLEQVYNIQRGIGDVLGQTVEAGYFPREEMKKSLFFRSWMSKESQDAHIQIISAKGKRKVVSEEPEYRFIITDARFPMQEKFSVVRTFGEDPDFLSTFGEDVKFWTFAGQLRNERRIQSPMSAGDGDWVNAIQQRYQTEYRASLLARRRQMIRLTMADMVIEGYMLNLSVNRNSQRMDDRMAGFQFKMLVRDFYSTSKAALAGNEPNGSIDASEEETA
jgi:hypothetical protein